MDKCNSKYSKSDKEELEKIAQKLRNDRRKHQRKIKKSKIDSSANCTKNYKLSKVGPTKEKDKTAHRKREISPDLYKRYSFNNSFDRLHKLVEGVLNKNKQK